MEGEGRKERNSLGVEKLRREGKRAGCMVSGLRRKDGGGGRDEFKGVGYRRIFKEGKERTDCKENMDLRRVKRNGLGSVN